MSQDVKMYDLLISCPGDITDEIEIIKQVIDDFNERFQSTLGMGIRIRYWKQSSYSQSGGTPQDLLNKQFVYNCDLAIGILWTRFGTPTDQYGSGTEEEIEYMLDNNKQVFMYFSNKLISPSTYDDTGYKKVCEFKEKYLDRGIFYEYEDNADFEKKLFADLTSYFMSKFNEEKNTTQNYNLELYSINQDSVNTDAIIEKYSVGDIPRKEARIEQIKDQYIKIESIQVSKNSNLISTPLLGMTFSKKVEFPENNIQYLKNAAEIMSIKLSDSFFDLGNLSENNSGVLGNNSINGNDAEKKKYEELWHLIKMINSHLAWVEIENKLCKYNIVKFVIKNSGNSFEENIDIELRLPHGILLNHDSLDIVSENSINVLEDNWDLEDLFEIQETSEYDSYYSSCIEKPSRYFNPTAGIGLPWSNPPYEEVYKKRLDYVFPYKTFFNAQIDTIKLHIDSIKQYCSVAFPTPLFLNNISEDISFEYRITSKNNPNKIEKFMKLKYKKE